LRRLSSGYWWVVALGAAFTLARFSEAFLVLRSQQMGIPIALVPLVMVLMSLIYSGTAYPFGKLSDSMSHGQLLAVDFVFLSRPTSCSRERPAWLDCWSASVFGDFIWG
jgi:hypothetical protein